MSRRRFVLGSVVASCLLFGGCYGPTLPLPPPTALSTAPDADGIVTVSGQVLGNAYVLVLNLDTDSGVIGRGDEAGAFTVRLAAQAGHTLEVTQMIGSQHGQVTAVTVPAR
jgi:hypothetical protein